MKTRIKQLILCCLLTLMAIPSQAGRVGDRFTYDGVTYEITRVPTKNADGSLNGNLEVGIVTTTRTGDVTFESVVTDSVGSTFYVTSVMSRGLDDLSGITTVRFTEGMRSLGFHTLRVCPNLTKVYLPSSVTSVDSHCCVDCGKFEGFEVDAANETFYSQDGVLFKHEGNGKTGIVVYPDARVAASYSIPEGVTHIHTYAFDRGSATTLTDLTLPSTLTDIDGSAYFICQLTHFHVASGNTSFIVDDDILYSADRTRLVAVPIKKTGDLAVDSRVSEIRACAFKSSELTTVDMSDCTGLTELKFDTFRGMGNLKTLSLPASITTLAGSIARESSCLAIHVADGNTTFKSVDGVVYTKDGTKLVQCPPRKNCSKLNDEDPEPTNEYTVLDGTTEIGTDAFYEGGLVTVNFPASLTTIGNNAFQWNGHLTTVNIASGSALATIGNNAFWECGSLTSINLSGCPITTVGRAAFEKCHNLTSAIIATTNLDKIEGYVFNECEHLTDVGNLGITKITSIGERAFNNVPLASVNLPATLTSIGASAFSKDENFTVLTSVAFANPANVTSIGDNAFQNNKKMAQIDLSRFTSLTTIGNQAFSGCEQFLNVTIPASVERMGYQAFLFCRNLKSIDVADGNAHYRDIDGMLLTKNGKKLLAYPGGKMGTNFKFQTTDRGTNNYVMIPPVDEIGDSVFYSCYTVRDIKLPPTVKAIGRLAFYRTLNLRYLSVMSDTKPTYTAGNNIKLNEPDPREGHESETLGDGRQPMLFVRQGLDYKDWTTGTYAFKQVYHSFDAAGMEYFPWTETSDTRMVAPGDDPDQVVGTNKDLADGDEDLVAGANTGMFFAPRRVEAADHTVLGFSDNGWNFEKVALVDLGEDMKTAIIPDSIYGDIGMTDKGDTKYQVRLVMDDAFKNAGNLTDATFFGNLEYIAPNAFATGKSDLSLYFLGLRSKETFQPVASATGNYGDVYDAEVGDNQKLYVKKSVYDKKSDDDCPQLVALYPDNTEWQIKKLSLSAVNGQPYTAATLCREFDVDMSGCEAVMPYRLKESGHWEKDPSDPATVTGYLNAWSVPDKQIHAGEGILLRADAGTDNSGLFYAIRETQGFTTDTEAIAAENPDFAEGFYDENALIGVYTAQTLTGSSEIADSYTPVGIQPNGYPKTADEISAETPATPTFMMGWSSAKGMFVKALYSGNAADNIVPAFRALYKAPDVTANYANVNLIMSFSETDVTGITGVKTADNDAPYYGIDGIRYERPTHKGVYIRNGKKEVVK